MLWFYVIPVYPSIGGNLHRTANDFPCGLSMSLHKGEFFPQGSILFTHWAIFPFYVYSLYTRANFTVGGDLFHSGRISFQWVFMLRIPLLGCWMLLQVFFSLCIIIYSKCLCVRHRKNSYENLRWWEPPALTVPKACQAISHAFLPQRYGGDLWNCMVKKIKIFFNP